MLQSGLLIGLLLYSPSPIFATKVSTNWCRLTVVAGATCFPHKKRIPNTVKPVVDTHHSSEDLLTPYTLLLRLHTRKHRPRVIHGRLQVLGLAYSHDIS